MKDLEEVPWRRRLQEMDGIIARRPPVVGYAKRMKYQDEEIGVRHPDNKSYMKINTKGDIDLFVDETLGIKLDKSSQGMRIFANNTSIIAQDINFYTTPNGLTWNGYYLNPSLYTYEYKDFKLNGSYLTWDAKEERYVRTSMSIKPFVRKPQATIYNDGLGELLKNLNIPM